MKPATISPGARRALAELELRRRARYRRPVVEFVECVSAKAEKFEAPRHLSRLTAALERAELGPINVAVSVPPRHAKTETILHYIVWRLSRNPALKVAYLSYGASVALAKSARCREIAVRAGVPLRREFSRGNWSTQHGGGLFAGGVGGPLTSFGFDLIIVDDPHKNRAEAESATVREATHGWLTSTAMTRLEPGGSFIVCHTRWHEDDTIGRLVKAKLDWEYIELPALVDGVALWPERWPAELLQERRQKIGEYDWASLFMCQPMARGGTVYQDTRFLEPGEVLPKNVEIAVGLDFAYTERTHSDYSVAVVGAKHKGKLVILEVLRRQVSTPEWGNVLVELRKKYKTAKFFAIIGAGEKGVVDLFNSKPYSVGIRTKIANGDKLTRALPSAAAWNRGEIVLSLDGSGLDEFVGEVLVFTGVSDVHDDQIDALAALHHAFFGGANKMVDALDAVLART